MHRNIFNININLYRKAGEFMGDILEKISEFTGADVNTIVWFICIAILLIVMLSCVKSIVKGLASVAVVALVGFLLLGPITSSGDYIKYDGQSIFTKTGIEISMQEIHNIEVIDTYTDGSLELKITNKDGKEYEVTALKELYDIISTR